MVFELFGYPGIKIVAIVIEMANIGLLTGLLYLYTKSYRQIKIGFTVGLILFALMLLLKSISTIVFLFVDSDLLIGRPVYIGGIIEFIALAILLKITWDY
ncbi:MAG TPA: hypothetical protein VK426_01400 [Methanobacterium sp.]|nr:hypothetical protein [Methanobacterium sp.]